MYGISHFHEMLIQNWDVNYKFEEEFYLGNRPIWEKQAHPKLIKHKNFSKQVGLNFALSNKLNLSLLQSYLSCISSSPTLY